MCRFLGRKFSKFNENDDNDDFSHSSNVIYNTVTHTCVIFNNKTLINKLDDKEVSTDAD